jgi:hypothetical protein
MRLVRPLFVALLLLALPAAGAAAAPSDPFRGSWVSIDVVDASSQRLSFGGNGATRMIVLRDKDATVACGGGFALVKGEGTIAGDTISGTLTVTCANGSPSFDVAASFTHVSGTLVDGFGSTWERP